jgi:internalin A
MLAVATAHLAQHASALTVIARARRLGAPLRARAQTPSHYSWRLLIRTGGCPVSTFCLKIFRKNLKIRQILAINPQCFVLLFNMGKLIGFFEGSMSSGGNMSSREQQVQALQHDWDTNPRWKGVKRTYSAEDVVRLRGLVKIEHPLAKSSAEIWCLINGGHVGNATKRMAKRGKPPESPLAPVNAIRYGISYAWTEASKAEVDRLCRVASERGIAILRDTTVLRLGDRITRFMQLLSTQDRVFVILSDKYFKSPSCMYELFEIWRNMRGRDDDFLSCVRVYKMNDVEIFSVKARATIAAFWKEQFAELDAIVKQHGASILGDEDFRNYKRMQDFAHHIGDILHAVADTLQPQDFDQLVQHGFA